VGVGAGVVGGAHMKMLRMVALRVASFFSDLPACDNVIEARAEQPSWVRERVREHERVAACVFTDWIGERRVLSS